MISRNIILNSIEGLPPDTAVCLGFFDGLHLGHQALITKAKQIGKKVALLTLDESPKRIIRKNDKRKTLTSIDDRISLLEKLEVDYYLVLKFTEEVRTLSPHDFVEKVLLKLNPSVIVVGFDYRFGHSAKGSVSDLLSLSGSRFKIEVVEPILYQGLKISTSAIITEIEKGKIDNVSAMLGRYYQIKGKVIQGLGNGHMIGFPTANLELLSDYPLPQNGVYAVNVVYNKNRFLGMANIGVHPSIQVLDKENVEINIFDFDKDIYCETLVVEFIKFVRGEKKFASIELLKNQLRNDESAIRKELGGKI